MEEPTKVRARAISGLTRNNMSGNNDEGQDAKVMQPKYGTETHGSPASEGGIKEDEGKV